MCSFQAISELAEKDHSATVATMTSHYIHLEFQIVQHSDRSIQFLLTFCFFNVRVCRQVARVVTDEEEGEVSTSNIDDKKQVDSHS